MKSFRCALRIELLRFQINSYLYQLHSIAAQRANDVEIERVLRYEMLQAKSKLKQFELDSSRERPPLPGNRSKRLIGLVRYAADVLNGR